MPLSFVTMFLSSEISDTLKIIGNEFQQIKLNPFLTLLDETLLRM